MNTINNTPPKSLKLTSNAVKTGADLPLPGILRSTTRSGVSEVDPLLAGLVVETVYSLGTPTRGEPAGEAEKLDTEKPQLLAVETEDGTTLFIRSDTLAEAVARLQPEAVVDGEVDRVVPSSVSTASSCGFPVSSVSALPAGSPRVGVPSE